MSRCRILLAWGVVGFPVGIFGGDQIPTVCIDYIIQGRRWFKYLEIPRGGFL
jgi:hypothetical protein